MPARPPNILLVVVDQMRADAVASLGGGVGRTPTLDALARAGTAFDRAYTPSPVCMAARCGMLTGLPPRETGCADNAPWPADADTLPARLGRLGYQTHGVGKMHFAPDPWAGWGFDSRDTSEELALAGEEGRDDYRAFLRREGFGHVREPHGLRGEWYYVPQPSQLPERLHHTRWCADRSIDFLRRRDRGRPYFLTASFIKPHPPFESPPPWDRLFRGPEMPPPQRHPRERSVWTYWNRVQNRYKYADAGGDRRLQQLRAAAYYGCVGFVDHEVGRILAEAGDDALVLFTSDHGEFLGDYGCVGKRSMLDPACRVPLIARWPGRFPAGRRCGTAASLLDVLPTCLAAAGADDPAVHGEGADLVPIARGAAGGRVVTSQYQRGRYALYMAADRRGKFARSAPDDRSWHFAGDSLDARPEVARQGDGGDEFDALEAELHARLPAEATDGRRWVEYEPPVFPEDPRRRAAVPGPAGRRGGRAGGVHGGRRPAAGAGGVAGDARPLPPAPADPHAPERPDGL